MHSLDDLRKREASLRAQILDLQHQLTEVLTLQNAVLPISRIPSDILLPIFYSLIPAFSLVSDDAQVRAISQVNRSWRNLALSSPGLWTHIFLWRDRDYVNEALQRSCDILLSLSVRQGLFHDEVRALITSEVHRTRAFAYRRYTGPGVIPPTEELTAFLKLVLPSPALKDLQISGPEPGPSAWGAITWPQTGIAGSFERLELHGTAILERRIVGPVLHSVTRFVFACPGEPFTNMYSENKLIDVLGAMPNLESLTFADVASRGDSWPNGGRVALPRLSFLEAISVLPIWLITILNRLKLPQNVRYRVVLPDKEQSFPENTSTLFASCHSVALQWTPANGSQPACASLRAFAEDADIDRALPVTEIVIRDPAGQMRPPHHLAALAQRAMHTLVVAGFDDLPHDPSKIYPVGAMLPRCRTLRLVRCGPRALAFYVAALLVDERKFPSVLQWKKTPYAPSLRHLEVCDLQSGSAEEGSTWCAKLLELADRRRERGVPLERVSFSDVWGESDMEMVYTDVPTQEVE